jgi:hypothetical protein
MAARARKTGIMVAVPGIPEFCRNKRNLIRVYFVPNIWYLSVEFRSLECPNPAVSIICRLEKRWLMSSFSSFF